MRVMVSRNVVIYGNQIAGQARNDSALMSVEFRLERQKTRPVTRLHSHGSCLFIAIFLALPRRRRKVTGRKDTEWLNANLYSCLGSIIYFCGESRNRDNGGRHQDASHERHEFLLHLFTLLVFKLIRTIPVYHQFHPKSRHSMFFSHIFMNPESDEYHNVKTLSLRA